MKMSYSVKEQPKAGTQEIEYIVVDCDGVMAPAPHGGPFASETEAIAAREILKRLTIEQWFALYPDFQQSSHIEGSGRVWFIAPDGRWIQHRGRNNFGVHPSTDLELEVGERVWISQSGEIKLIDREPRLGIGR